MDVLEDLSLTVYLITHGSWMKKLVSTLKYGLGSQTIAQESKHKCGECRDGGEGRADGIIRRFGPLHLPCGHTK